MLKTVCKSSVLAVIAGMIGCQTSANSQLLLIFRQTPPAVRSAFLANYGPVSSILKIVCEPIGNQDYYTFMFVDQQGHTREVELNEAGDEIDQH